LLDAKSGSAKFAGNCRKVLGGDHNVGIDCIDRLDVAVHGQAADQTPRTVTPQDFDNGREIARAAVGHRFVDFLRGHGWNGK
jgi:hypothetical protein